MRYTENFDASVRFKQEYLDSLNELIADRQYQAERERRAYAAEILSDPERCRREFREMLGWPLTEPKPKDPPTVTYCEKLTEENGVTVFRMQFQIIGNLKMTGLFFRQNGDDAKPLVISQHRSDEHTSELQSR